MQSTCCQTQNAKRSLQEIAGLLHFTGLAQWQQILTFVMDSGGRHNHLESLLFPESHVLCLFWDETEREEGGKKKKKIKNRQEGKNNFLLKSRVTLCWWTCGAHQDEKELPQLWNPPVKINILFKPLSGKGRGEMRESKRERERKRARRKRKR